MKAYFFGLILIFIGALLPEICLTNPLPSQQEQSRRFIELQLFGENPANFKVFEAVDSQDPRAGEITSATILEYHRRYGHWPKVVLVGQNERLHEIKSSIDELVGLQNKNFESPTLLNIDDFFESEPLPTNRLHEEINSRLTILRPTRNQTRHLLPTSREVSLATLHGFTLGLVGGVLWYFDGHSLQSAINIGILMIFERIAYLSFRPLIDGWKRKPDAFLARKLKNRGIWWITSASYKTLIDVLFVGIVLVHLPRALPWGLQVYEGDYVINFSDMTFTSFVLWNLLIQSFLHSISDPFGLAKIFNEGLGVINRRFTNAIGYIKPYITSSMTLMRIGKNHVDIANFATFIMIGIGVVACVLPWPHIFHFFGGGEVLIGPDLRPKYIRKKHAFGIRYLIENPDPISAPGRHMKIETFIGYRPIFENGEQALKFDNTSFLLLPERISINEVWGEDIRTVYSLELKAEILRSMSYQAGQDLNYRIRNGHIEVEYDGRSFTVEMPFESLRGFDDFHIDHHSNTILETRKLSIEEAKLIVGLRDMQDFRIKSIKDMHRKKGNKLLPTLLVESEGLKIYHRFGYHFFKNQRGEFSRLPEKGYDFVDYMTAMNESMGYYLKRVLSDANGNFFITRFGKRVSQHSHLFWQFLKTWGARIAKFSRKFSFWASSPPCEN